MSLFRPIFQVASERGEVFCRFSPDARAIGRGQIVVEQMNFSGGHTVQMLGGVLYLDRMKNTDLEQLRD